MTRRAVLFAVLSAASSAEPQSFDAVSIKPNHSGRLASETNTTPGRLSLENVTPISLIQRAFGVLNPQIVDAPGWANTERFDVLAVTGGADRLSDKERQPFLQAMLADRWSFRFHREMREIRVYSLTTMDSIKLAPPAGGEYSMKVGAVDGRQVLRSTRGNIPRLVEMLSGQIGGLVIDDTGLGGQYDFTLEWVPDTNPEATGPSLFTALKEQLGLRLESARRPVEVIVIERIEQPSEN